jgi:hypothetical protein
MDGRYNAERNQVWKKPTRTATGFRMGFPICQINEDLSEPETVAQLVADALNAHLDANPEAHD